MNKKKAIKTDPLIPPIDETFVPFGSYFDVSAILSSKIFFPIFLYGPTRSGKTLIPLQVCAEQKRHLYRANITVETDESDLIGGYRLVDGNTVWEDGPAVLAAEDPEGGILLLDEVSLGDNKLLCLQPLLEGKGMYIKKQKRWVKPTPGFNIIATDNTKGRGADSGKYTGTNIMNLSTLERFAVYLEQTYPEQKVEGRILNNNLALHGIKSPEFVNCLTQWAENIRKTYDLGGTDEVITTGRLVHIINGYCIFGQNRIKTIKQTLALFDNNTQSGFLDAYMKIDAGVIDGPDNVSESKIPAPVRKPW